MKRKINFLLLGFGTFCLFVPLAFLLMFPDFFERAYYPLRIITAMGGALMASQIPGFLSLELRWLRAGGAMAVFVLLYRFDPPSALKIVVAGQERKAASDSNTQTKVDCVAALSAGKTCTVEFSREGGNDSLSTIARGHVYTLKYRDGEYVTNGYVANRGMYRVSRYPGRNPALKQFVMRGASFSYNEEGTVTSVRDTKAGRKLEGTMFCPQ